VNWFLEMANGLASIKQCGFGGIQGQVYARQTMLLLYGHPAHIACPLRFRILSDSPI
jgi:hypothetical protein